MPGREADAWIEIGAFDFCASSGLLRERATGDEVQLAPKPAAMLSLLVARAGELATREALREALWPDVTVDFDANLHQCARQLRVALGDRASDPRYVQTVPRRGYKLICEVREPAESMVGPRPNASPSTAGPPHARSRRVFVGAGLVLAAAAGVGAWWWLRPSPLRLGIMAFARPTMPDALADSASRAGARVLDALTEQLGRRVDVVGPRTTEPIRARSGTLRDVARALELDFILNLKHVGANGSRELLLELIRVPDGRHVWVERFDGIDERAAGRIVEGTVAALT